MLKRTRTYVAVPFAIALFSKAFVIVVLCFFAMVGEISRLISLFCR